MLVASSIKTDHVLALLIFESFLPAAEMVIEGLGGEGLVRAFTVSTGSIHKVGSRPRRLWGLLKPNYVFVCRDF